VTAVEAQLDEIARRHGIELILVFGSSVSGPVHTRSDVDLAVLLDRPTLSLGEHGELAGELQRLFPEREVDVVLINRADPLFLKKITERCRLLYGSTRRLAELKLYAFRRYQDHRKYLTLEREYVSRALGAGRRP
jgi:predicted nucleotidyltransferase